MTRNRDLSGIILPILAMVLFLAPIEVMPNGGNVDNEFAEFEVSEEAAAPNSLPSFGLDEEYIPPIHSREEEEKETDEMKSPQKQEQRQNEEDRPKKTQEKKERKSDDSSFSLDDEFESAFEHAPDQFNDIAEEEDSRGGAKDKDGAGEKGEQKAPGGIKPLTFADIPAHFSNNWKGYQVEGIVLLIVCIYMFNYAVGKSANYSIAYKWFSDNQNHLENQFALVGDTGGSEEPSGGHLLRESDSSYLIWSSGRVGCQGMLTRIRLCKRQDLLGLAVGLFRSQADRIVHKINLDRGEMDSFVFIFGQKKHVARTVKEMNDLSTFVTERKNLDRGIVLPPSFSVYAEVAETIPSILDSSTLAFLKRYEAYIEYVHISDQFSGVRNRDAEQNGPSRLPDTAPTLVFSFFLSPSALPPVSSQENSGGGGGQSGKRSKPTTGNVVDNPDEVQALLLNFMFVMLDKVRRYRLSREAKMKADKKRMAVEEQFLKLTHSQRQELAQNRREEKTRERRQRLMEEEDPEKQRRLEEKEKKREAKQKQPKLKAFKIK